MLNRYCIHKFLISNFRLLLTAVVVAAKYNDDEFFKNDYYRKVGGITLEEFNLLENTFINLLDYRLFIREKEFLNYI